MKIVFHILPFVKICFAFTTFTMITDIILSHTCFYEYLHIRTSGIALASLALHSVV